MILIDNAPFLMELIKPSYKAVVIEPVPFMDIHERVYTGQIIPIKKDFWLDEEGGIEQMMTKQNRNWNAVFPYGDVGQNKARVGPNDISYIKTRF